MLGHGTPLSPVAAFDPSFRGVPTSAWSLLIDTNNLPVAGIDLSGAQAQLPLATATASLTSGAVSFRVTVPLATASVPAAQGSVGLALTMPVAGASLPYVASAAGLRPAVPVAFAALPAGQGAVAFGVSVPIATATAPATASAVGLGLVFRLTVSTVSMPAGQGAVAFQRHAAVHPATAVLALASGNVGLITPVRSVAVPLTAQQLQLLRRALLTPTTTMAALSAAALTFTRRYTVRAAPTMFGYTGQYTIHIDPATLNSSPGHQPQPRRFVVALVRGRGR